MVGLGNIDDVYKHYLVVIEKNQQLKELLLECREVIHNLIDDEPCRYDHHGYCQEHNWLSDGVCPHKQGKKLISQIDNVIGEKK